MLQVIVKSIMGRTYVSVFCNAHGEFPHCVWSRQRVTGPEDAASELALLADAGLQALRDWERGLFDFTDDCFPGESNNPWNRPAG